MEYDRITLGRLAKEQGFVRDTLEKVCRLTDILLFMQLFSQKQYKPELLFDDAAVLARIAHHPMAIWKCEARGTQQPVR